MSALLKRWKLTAGCRSCDSAWGMVEALITNLLFPNMGDILGAKLGGALRVGAGKELGVPLGDELGTKFSKGL